MIRKSNLFLCMIIAHIAAMMLYVPATGGGYRNSIVYTAMCAAVTVYEIYVCVKDDRHEVFWILYLILLAAGLFVIHRAQTDPGYIAELPDYIVLFLGAPVYMGFSVPGQLKMKFAVIEVIAAGLLGVLLFIIVKRLLNKKSQGEKTEK